MRIPSRDMPARPVNKSVFWFYPVMFVVIAWILWILSREPFALGVVCAIAIAIWILELQHRWKRRTIAADRVGESICTFARSLDWRHTDTWVIRAVYEELADYLTINNRPFPICPDDQLCKNGFNIDEEDLEGLIISAAVRAGRSMEETQQNPYRGKVSSVRDVVNFIEHQPNLR